MKVFAVAMIAVACFAADSESPPLLTNELMHWFSEKVESPRNKSKVQDMYWGVPLKCVPAKSVG